MRAQLCLVLWVWSLAALGQSRTIDSLQRVIDKRTRDTLELGARLNLVFELTRTDPRKAKLVAHQTAKLADSIKQVRWLNSSYTYLVSLYQEFGLIDSARYFLAKAEQLCRAKPEDKRMQISFLRSAGLFHKNQGEYKTALPYTLKALEMWSKQDETKAGQLLNLGNLHAALGDFQNAANYHLQGLRLFEELKNLRGQSFCLQSLGNDFFHLNQFITAREYYERSLQIKKQIGDKRGVLVTTASLGDTYKDMNDYQRAEFYYQSALAMTREMKLPAEEARALHQSGLLYRRMKENKKARENFVKSMEISKQLGDSTTWIKTRSELLSLDLSERAQEKTEAQMLEGLNMLIRTGDRQQQALEYHRLSEYYAQHKDFEKAFYYLQKHEALSDSVEGNAVLMQLKELEEKYNSEKKERQIALLKKDQQLQALELQKQRANTTIIIVVLISVVVIGALLVNRYRVMNRSKRQAELEKMRLNIAQDLHDDIGSTLSSINIMSQVATQTNAAEQLQKIASHSSRMMESMSDIVWSINPKNDSLEQVVAKLKEFASEILEPRNITYDFQAPADMLDMKLDVEKRKNIFLIFKEAINNAAKYSEGTHVQVALVRTGDSFQLSVRDDGKGFNPHENGKGNGLKNMEARARAMGGELETNSMRGAGTAIALKLPIT